ncbi:MAG: hypothetical protein CM15mP112_00870 [Flavobacteriales bacterium]|nr:MAG: hypothetical protein CM15mP112_00870 [Flavobacteriales bacterium]
MTGQFWYKYKFRTEDFTYKLWFSDNLNILPWIGYGPSGLPIEGTDNIINTQDDLAFNDDIVQVSYLEQTQEILIQLSQFLIIITI